MCGGVAGRESSLEMEASQGQHVWLLQLSFPATKYEELNVTYQEIYECH